LFNTTTPAWPSGGDATNPAVGQLFAYIVRAVDDAGAESLAGTSGTFNAGTCP
jgi:hypothetical protein